jgi:hypothetical protein
VARIRPIAKAFTGPGTHPRPGHPSRRTVDLAQTQYREGTISYTLVLGAQQFQLLNEDQLTAARGEVARNLIATCKALGGAWQIREGRESIRESTLYEMRQRTNWGDLLEDQAIEPPLA